MRRTQRIATGVIAGVLGLGILGYGLADAYDASADLPGFLTTAPPVEVQALPEPRAQAPEVTEPASALHDSAPVPGGIGTVVSSVLKDSAVKGLGIEVRDGLSNEILYARDEDTARTPASVTKVFTASAALLGIGAQTRLSTKTTFDPQTSTVTLVGGGDVLLSAGRSAPDAVNGHAGLTTLAQQTAAALQEEGITEVALELDTSRYPGKDFNPGWERADIGKGVITPIQPLMIDTGYVGKKEWRPRSEHPAADAFAVFRNALQKDGVTVSEDPKIPAAKGTSPATDTQEREDTAAEAEPQILAHVESATVSEIVEYALVNSDNVVAEVLGREVAIAAGEKGSMAAAPQAVLDTLQGTVDVGATHLEDTSGLDYANKISPHDLAGVLRTSVVSEGPLSSLISYFPVGGLDGTLASRFDDRGTAGRVHAKTGTLSTVTSLAGGVLDADGRYLVFALQTDGVEKGKTLEARAVIDDIVTQLADCGCA